MRPARGNNMTGRIFAVFALLCAVPLAAAAQSYRCVGADGKRYYGSAIPQECFRRPVEQLNAQGLVVKRIDPTAAEKERRAKEAAEAKKKEDEAASREASRRNQALLATYTSEKDIEEARARALADNGRATREVEERIEAIRKRQAGYEKEAALHKGKPELPVKLRDDMKNADDELKAQHNLLENKQREASAINARYDEDKKRYGAITSRR
jgi:Domain of unknown function (DUF4124)